MSDFKPCPFCKSRAQEIVMLQDEVVKLRAENERLFELLDKIQGEWAIVRAVGMPVYTQHAGNITRLLNNRRTIHE